ncbi:hypothetical protein KIN20_029634 [Parelaphostrongylus tenuis]|uniref:Uncharacterized protein n=1 Tax=Parelaphostrongylus tenuis TaxID=148309 RepID=A0AAD5WFS4_PARTN|nr:hypothetical protein KIN20_029634 [Parelaphostrongylus tenuis]
MCAVGHSSRGTRLSTSIVDPRSACQAGWLLPSESRRSITIATAGGISTQPQQRMCGLRESRRPPPGWSAGRLGWPDGTAARFRHRSTPD